MSAIASIAGKSSTPPPSAVTSASNPCGVRAPDSFLP
jgi:hypothetical protein